MKEEVKTKQACVQCGLTCQAQTEGERTYNVCVRPECANYGLLQVDIDQIKKFTDEYIEEDEE